MAKNFDELRKKMSPERQARVRAKTDRMRLEMNLQELRQQVADLNQEEVAEFLDVTQGYISKLERRGDMSISRLREYVAALGGEIEIKAVFKDREVIVKQLGELDQLLAR